MQISSRQECFQVYSIYTMFIDRKRTDNDSDIRIYINAHCKLVLVLRKSIINYVLFMGNTQCSFPQFIGDVQN